MISNRASEIYARVKLRYFPLLKNYYKQTIKSIQIDLIIMNFADAIDKVLRSRLFYRFK